MAQVPKNDRTVLWIVVAAVVVVVVVVVPAVLYFMVMGFGPDGTTPAVIVARKTEIQDGFKIEFTAPSSEVGWSEVTIQLYVGIDVVSWNNIPIEGLTSPTQPAVWHGTQKTDGAYLVGVYLNVTDLAANGRMSNGDYVTIQMPSGFSSSLTYTLTLVYEPTAGPMLSYSFTG